MSYPLCPTVKNGTTLRPLHNFCSDEYIQSNYELYMTKEPHSDQHRNVQMFYRLHARNPHTVDMALRYDIKCPKCSMHTLKQVGDCLNAHDLGLYTCPVCDMHKGGN